MSNETRSNADVTARPAASDPRDQATVDPNVPITADLPMVPEFRDRAEAINWRAALSAAGLAAFLAAVAGIGCGTKPAIPKPSPAIPIAESSPTVSVLAGRNFGQARR